MKKGFPLNMPPSKRSVVVTWHVTWKRQPTRARENWQFTALPTFAPVSVKSSLQRVTCAGHDEEQLTRQDSTKCENAREISHLH
jgi:hypothetical protein